jgi:hypothetical protein
MTKPITETRQPDCGNYNTVGSRCVQPPGHEGPHRASHGFQWTDESTRRAAEAMVKALDGRRD